MANIDVTITGGNGSAIMPAGNYNVSVQANGYDSTTLEPTTFTATDQGATGNFTVKGAGTLTVNVNETGTAGGTPIASGSLRMTNADGSEDYGSAVTITNGVATFANVPYGDTATPFVLYVKQESSDGSHYPFTGVLTVSMTEQTQTAYMQNLPYTEQTFTLSDGTYTGMPVPSATLTLSEQA